MIYLDNAATTLHKPPEIAEAVKQAILTAGNAARGAHCVSLAASRTVFETRRKLAQLFSCPREDHVVFTMNSTEALNIAIYGLLSPGDHVISTDLEHNSVLRPLYDLQTRGVFVDFVPADRLGNVRYEAFEALFRENTKAIVCTHASNLTGNVLDIARISEIAHARGALLIVDASQSAGVIRKEYGEQADHLTSKEQLENGEGFRKTKTDQQTPETAPLGSVRYDLIGKLVEETGLTRASIAAILQGMPPLKFAMFRNNPEAFILKVGRIINNQKATMIVEHITYNRLEAAYDSDIFAAGKLRGKLNVSAMRAEKSLYDHVIYDSENERKFAGELDISEKVAVYVKLPSSFFISTPVGHYNQDWAIAFTEGSVRHIFFVAETKGNTDSLELRGVENAKIECARRHFAAISNEEVVYEVVDSFEKLMQKVI